MILANRQTAFIDEIAPIMVRLAKEYGYKTVAASIAQACCESGFGNTWSRQNNLFGLKYGTWVNRTVLAGKVGCTNAKTQENYGNGLVTIVDGFCKCNSIEDSCRLYYEFLRVNSRYKNLLTATTPEQFTAMIKADGYATSATYQSTIMSYVNTYNMKQYDAQLSGSGATAAITIEQISKAGVVTATWLKVRTGPGTGHSVVTNASSEELQLPKGIICAFSQLASNGWARLQNTDYWVSSQYIQF